MLRISGLFLGLCFIAGATGEDLPNRKPFLVDPSPPTQIRLGETYRYQFRAQDPDGDSITFWMNGPVGIRYNERTGLVELKPDHPGRYYYDLSIVDGPVGIAPMVTEQFSVEVLPQTAMAKLE